MAIRLFKSNDSHASGLGGFVEDTVFLNKSVQGEVTADSLGHILWIVPSGVSGSITGVVGAVVENGSDASNPLTMTFTVKKNGTAVASTDPAIAKNAASDALIDTVAAGTGITQVVLKTDGTEDFVAGDVISVDFDITRTASPTTEITGPAVTVTCKLNAL